MPVSSFSRGWHLSVLANLRKAASLDDLALILGYTPKGLAYVVYKLPAGAKYIKFKIPKASGGEREISAPTEQLKTLQKHLANALYACRDEIEAGSKQRALSHGFRRGYSIITNARQHKRRRYVLNIDLKDFFQTLNFGRVRGFFIHNNAFKLNEKIATIIAQIACFENALPQGSPCSPIISDLLAHLLDVRLAQLAKKNRLTFSRYADDITFSTSQREFPVSLAKPSMLGHPLWEPGNDLTNAILTAGFTINPAKTRMQLKMSRQLVTGLTVNTKVNTRPEYYRLARAMCSSLFKTGSYHRAMGASTAGPETVHEVISELDPIKGILSHIHHVKDTIDGRDEQCKWERPTAFRQLYVRFLKYQYFVRLEQPLIVCEGKTDNIYLKCAIRRLTKFHPILGTWSDAKFHSAVNFFSYQNRSHKLLGIRGGAGDLRYFFIKNRYKEDIHRFKHRPLKYPVIVLIDNDDGAKDIFAAIKKNFEIQINTETTDPFFHITDNLYLVKTPELGKNNSSCIEDLFDPALLKFSLDGKKFNPKCDKETTAEFGKSLFAERVVRPNADTIDFSGFAALLDRIVKVIDHYTAPI